MKCNLSEIVEIINGGTPKTTVNAYWNGKIPWLSVKDFNNDNRYVYSTEKTITEEGLENSSTTLLQRDDIILSARGTVGALAMIPYSMAFNQSCYGIRAKAKLVDKVYLYYLLKFNVGKLKKNTHGSVFDTITRDTFSSIEIDLPDLATQKKIAKILSALDDKIECNNQINEKLYDLLRLSFKFNYINKASSESGWKKVTLNEVTSKFGTGLNPRKNFVLGRGNNYYVTIKNMRDNRIYLNDRCDKIDDGAISKIQDRSDLQVGDLLFSGIGTIGRVYLIDRPVKNWNTSESIFNLRPNNTFISSEFLFMLLISKDMQEYAVNLASGSVQKGIRMADLKRYLFLLPPKNIMESLTLLWGPIIKQIKNNEYENDSLIVLRDTLLPKLMSGELDVSDIDI